MYNLDFSIIIPTYNNLDLFKRAVDSVLMQKNISYEIIVVDDSTNNYIESHVKKTNQPPVRYYHNQPSKGAVANWNFGLSLAKGKYVEILHHDEALANEYILWKVKQQFETTHSHAVIANYKVLIEGVIKKEHPIKKHLYTVFIKHPILLFLSNLLGPCACVFIENYKIDHFDEKLHWLVDVDWYYRIFKNRKISMLAPNLVIASIHGHKGQITKSLDIQTEVSKDTQIIVSKYHCFFINILLKTNKLLNKSLVKKIIKKTLL